MRHIPWRGEAEGLESDFFYPLWKVRAVFVLGERLKVLGSIVLVRGEKGLI